MRIGVSSYSFAHYMRDTGANYSDICDRAKDLGFEGIEFIDLDPKLEGLSSQTELADALRAHCEALDLPIIAYTVHADFLEDPEEAERLTGQLEVARRLGARVFRHDVTWRRDVPWREIIRRTAPKIRQVAEAGARLGIRTCTENHGYVLQDAHRLEALMLAVDHPNYGWLVDFGNFLCADEPPMHALPIAAPWAVHAHAKDFLWKEAAPGEGWIPTRNGHALRGTVAGHGVVPIGECIAALKAAGYEGWLSLEFEGLEENLPALKLGLEYLKHAAEGR